MLYGEWHSKGSLIDRLRVLRGVRCLWRAKAIDVGVERMEVVRRCVSSSTPKRRTSTSPTTSR